MESKSWVNVYCLSPGIQREAMNQEGGMDGRYCQLCELWALIPHGLHDVAVWPWTGDKPLNYSNELIVPDCKEVASCRRSCDLNHAHLGTPLWVVVN